jgi:hypothetical protein
VFEPEEFAQFFDGRLHGSILPHKLPRCFWVSSGFYIGIISIMNKCSVLIIKYTFMCRCEERSLRRSNLFIVRELCFGSRRSGFLDRPPNGAGCRPYRR